MLFSSPAGNDLLYDQKLIDQGRNFNNKLWNAFRLVKGWETDDALPFANEQAVRWFEAKLAEAVAALDEHFDKFRMRRRAAGGVQAGVGRFLRAVPRNGEARLSAAH